MVLFVAAGVSISAAFGAEPAIKPDSIPAEKCEIIIRPINHATLALQWNGKTLYVDPVGGAAAFQALPAPDLILITDIHGDHLNKETLEAVTKAQTKLVVPPAVAEQLSEALRAKATILENGKKAEVQEIPIEAIPAYNLTASRMQYHPKGRGNGYVLSLGGKRVYISGDTEGTPEMKSLRDIDVAFLCMNLPYTMDVEQAAEAVRAFKPKIVYPFHYRGSDLEKFKTLVGADSGIEVRIKNWYP